MSPKISVVIPSYNYGKYRGKASEALPRNWAFSTDEVVIVENGSTDGSPEIARFLANEYPMFGS